MGTENFRLTETLDDLMGGSPEVYFAPLGSFSRHNSTLTYTAGPANVSEAVHRAESPSIVNHLDPRFIKVMNLNMQAVRVLFGREPNDESYPMIVPGTGSTAAGAAIYNLLNPGDLAVVVNQGFFGKRLVEFLQSYGINYEVVDAEWGQSVDPTKLETKLKEIHTSGRNVKALLSVLVETSTGVRDPNTRKYSDIYRDIFPKGYVIVDAVSAAGGFPISIDGLGADVVFYCVQKGIGSNQGSAVALFNERAVQEAVRTEEQRPDEPLEYSAKVPWQISARKYAEYLSGKSGQGPRSFIVTFPSQSGMALYQAYKELFDFPGGLESLFQTYEKASELLLTRAGEMGFTNFVTDSDSKGPTITVLKVPHGIRAPDYIAKLSCGYDTQLNAAFPPINNEAVRIGLLGPVNTQRLRVLQLLDNMGSGLRDLRGA